MATVTDISDLGAHVGQDVEVRGWIQTTRSHGKVAFAVVRDGSGILQCVVVRSAVGDDVWDAFHTLTQESSVIVRDSYKKAAKKSGWQKVKDAGKQVAIVGGTILITKAIVQ
jgi:asparaginyl-tRNA synthetase